MVSDAPRAHPRAYDGTVFGLTFEKLLLIGVIAAFIIGPDKLPKAAERLADAVKWLRGASTNAKSRMKEEMGDDFADVDWRKLDPRQYDPRRIIRDALLDSPSSGAAAATAATVTAAKVRAPAPIVPLGAGEAAPFDSEAT